MPKVELGTFWVVGGEALKPYSRSGVEITSWGYCGLAEELRGYLNTARRRGLEIQVLALLGRVTRYMAVTPARSLGFNPPPSVHFQPPALPSYFSNFLLNCLFTDVIPAAMAIRLFVRCLGRAA